jgi:hypothetical protein
VTVLATAAGEMVAPVVVGVVSVRTSMNIRPTAPPPPPAAGATAAVPSTPLVPIPALPPQPGEERLEVLARDRVERGALWVARAIVEHVRRHAASARDWRAWCSMMHAARGCCPCSR